MRNNVAAVEPQAAPEIPPTGAKPEKSKKIKIRGIKRSAFAMPYLALSIVFVIVPLFIMLYYAFTDGATGGYGQVFSRRHADDRVLFFVGVSARVGVEFVRAE